MLQLTEFENLAEKLNKGIKLSQMEQDVASKLHPHQSLIVYGSLAPGESNHHIMNGIRGSWIDGTVEGIKLEQGWGSLEGYPGMTFLPKSERQLIACKVLFSEELPDHWERLDQFEGDEYIRQIWPYILTNKQIGLASIYAIRHPNPASIPNNF